MSDLQNDDWHWFRELLVPLRTSVRSAHPSRAVLHAYLKGQLPDEWRVGVHSLDLNGWTLTEASQHVLTCRDCAQQLALMRQRELEHTPPWRDLWDRLPGAIRAHVAAYAIGLVVLFALNAFFVMVLPSPMVSRSCPSGEERARPEQPFNSQTAINRNLRLEGLNRPVKLPDSLSGECLPVPAPRPLWQTWWIGWVFLLWTLLVGLHILWNASPEPRPTVATGSVMRSLGLVPIVV